MFREVLTLHIIIIRHLVMASSALIRLPLAHQLILEAPSATDQSDVIINKVKHTLAFGSHSIFVGTSNHDVVVVVMMAIVMKVMMVVVIVLKVTYEMGSQLGINHDVVTKHFVAVVVGIHLK